MGASSLLSVLSGLGGQLRWSTAVVRILFKIN